MSEGWKVEWLLPILLFGLIGVAYFVPSLWWVVAAIWIVSLVAVVVFYVYDRGYRKGWIESRYGRDR